MTSQDWEWQRALNEFANSQTCQAGFAQLVLLTRPTLAIYLKLRGLNEEESEDIIQTTFLKTFEHRERIEFKSPAEWKAYTRLVATRLVIDRYGSPVSRETSMPQQDLDSSARLQVDYEDSLMEGKNRENILQAATDLWLGERLPSQDQRLLAAKMLFWDRKDLATVMHAMRALGCKEAEYEPTKFFRWITDDSILRRLAFLKMAINPEIMLGLILECKPSEIPEHFRTNRAETMVLMMRFCNYMSVNEVAQFMSGQLTVDEVQEILDRYESKIPFYSRMERLWQSMVRCSNRSEALGGTGLWKRTVFHYISNRMRHEDFVEWLGPSAELTGQSINKITLRGWMSNRRLHDELRKYLREGGGWDD